MELTEFWDREVELKAIQEKRIYKFKHKTRDYNRSAVLKFVQYTSKDVPKSFEETQKYSIAINKKELGEIIQALQALHSKMNFRKTTL